MLLKRKKLVHSAKGSEWEEHKYIQRIDGTYYYPDSYEGGRHLPDSSENEKISEDNDSVEISNLTVDDIEKLASEVINGNFGNGSIRKELLGENYQKIQDRVNEIMKTIGNKTVETSESTKEETMDAKKESSKKESASTGVSGVDIEKVLDVYKKKKRG